MFANFRCRPLPTFPTWKFMHRERRSASACRQRLRECVRLVLASLDTEHFCIVLPAQLVVPQAAYTDVSCLVQTMPRAALLSQRMWISHFTPWCQSFSIALIPSASAELLSSAQYSDSPLLKTMVFCIAFPCFSKCEPHVTATPDRDLRVPKSPATPASKNTSRAPRRVCGSSLIQRVYFASSAQHV